MVVVDNNGTALRMYKPGLVVCPDEHYEEENCLYNRLYNNTSYNRE